MPAVLDSESDVRRTAMDLLARREHSRYELQRKLIQRGASSEHVEAALDRLAEESLLSDSRYVESYVRSRANAGFGPVRIREELRQRGIARDAAEQALRESGFDWDETLQRLWQRKFAGEYPGDAREHGRQGRFLATRGFSMEAIGRLLRR